MTGDPVTRYDVTSPVERKDGRTFWVKCGIGFPTKDGVGISVYLDTLPVNGKLALFPAGERSRQKSDAAPPTNDPIPF